MRNLMHAWILIGVLIHITTFLASSACTERLNQTGMDGTQKIRHHLVICMKNMKLYEVFILHLAQEDI